MRKMRMMMLSEGVSRGPKKAAKTFHQLEILRSMFDLRSASASAHRSSLSYLESASASRYLSSA